MYVAGVTSSTDFPVRNPVQSTNAGWQDAFAAKFNSAGALLYSTYLGGVNVDIANAIAVDPAGNAYIAGQTTSANLAALHEGLQAVGLEETSSQRSACAVRSRVRSSNGSARSMRCRT